MAQRHGFSFDAVATMLNAVANGNGTMAQFSHPEFSGSGQWMRGGMTMVSDMFNNHLKSRVDNLCSELSNLIASQPDLLRSGSAEGDPAAIADRYLERAEAASGGFDVREIATDSMMLLL